MAQWRYHLLKASEPGSTVHSTDSTATKGCNTITEHIRISLFTPEWSASFDHQIVLLKILSVLELYGPLKWKLNFL